MQELHNLLDKLESEISSFEKVNLAVSTGSVGWHIEHSFKLIDQIVTTCRDSDPKAYEWQFNLKRFLIMSVAKKFPRGKAKAPKIVRPEGDITAETLVLSLEKVKENLKNWESLDKNVHFPHPFFGVINKKKTEEFLVLHTNHHWLIIRDILK